MTCWMYSQGAEACSRDDFTELEKRLVRLRRALRDVGLDLATIMRIELDKPQAVETADDNAS